MLIHTVIENEYKYAVAMDQTLTILIRAEERTEKGERMLYLQIEDDGGGYPREVLDSFAGKRRKTVEIRRSGPRAGAESGSG